MSYHFTVVGKSLSNRYRLTKWLKAYLSEFYYINDEKEKRDG
jgi:hypothetical protein